MSLPNTVRHGEAKYSFHHFSFLVMKDGEPWAIVKPRHKRKDLPEDPSGYEAYLISDPSQSYEDQNGAPRDAVRGLIRKVQ